MKQGCHGGWTTRMPATANRILSGLPSDVIEEYLGRQRMAFRWWPRLFGWEWRLLCSFQGLVFAVSIFNYMLTFVTLMFTCHLSALELAGDSTASIWTYIKLTVASTVMLCLEIWYNQGLAPISGLLPNPTILLDSVSVRYFHPSLILQHLHFTDIKLLILTWWWFINFIMNYLNWDINVMLGLSAAASNELGAAHPKAAKFSVLVVNANSIFISVVFSAVVLIFRADLSKPFASDSEVVQAVSNLIPSLAISVFLNGIQPILSGVAIGSGWQAIVAYVNLACYYIMGLPMGCLLGFKTSLGFVVGFKLLLLIMKLDAC
ncbi:protein DETOXIFICATION 41 [Citrus sinensis]|uniref:Protein DETOXIFICATION 41 n=1 Tax=Citrus sinensis TaxID=2711 RepID=A0ACB8MZL5_CITSI|nr:protein DETOXIFICATION 41 [Citrus sinensis]